MSDHLDSIGRRQFLEGASATAIGSALAGLLGNAGMAHAQPHARDVRGLSRRAGAAR
jgi:hypothetical protein